MAGGAVATGEVHLVDVSGGDVFFGAFGGGDVFGLGEGGGPGAELVGGFRGGGAALVGEGADFGPLTGVVVVEEEFGVEAEGVGAIVVNPAAGGSGGEGEVWGVLGEVRVEGVFEGGGIRDVSGEDAEGAGGDDGEGGAVVGGEVTGGVEEDKSGEVAELLGDLVGFSLERDGAWGEWWHYSGVYLGATGCIDRASLAQ